MEKLLGKLDALRTIIDDIGVDVIDVNYKGHLVDKEYTDVMEAATRVQAQIRWAQNTIDSARRKNKPLHRGIPAANLDEDQHNTNGPVGDSPSDASESPASFRLTVDRDRERRVKDLVEAAIELVISIQEKEGLVAKERWVKDRIVAAMELAIAIQETEGVVTDEHGITRALDDIANKAVLEIIRALGVQPDCTDPHHPPEETS